MKASRHHKIKIELLCLLLSTLLTGTTVKAQLSPLDGSVEGHIEAAQNYMQAQRWDYASYEWRTVLAQQPKNLQAILGLGEALCRSNLAEESINLLESARASFQTTRQKTELELALAQAYRQGNEFLKAGQLYEGILAREPYNSLATRGLVVLQAELPSQQRSQVKQVLSQNSQRAKASWKKSMQAGQYLDAARYMEMVAITNPSASTLNDYGLSLLMAGKFAIAGKVFEVLKRQDTSWRTYANAGVVSLSQGKSYQAQQEIEQAISIATDPNIRARLYNDLGYIYETAHKTTKARFAYERAIGLQPGFTKAQMNLGYIYQKDRDFIQAVTLYKALTEREPQNVEAWNQLGFSYELQHKEKQAIASYKKAVHLDPNYKPAYYNLGTLYRKINKVDQASEAFKKMTDIEFNEIENLKKKPEKTRPQPELFKYIDLFLVERL